MCRRPAPFLERRGHRSGRLTCSPRSLSESGSVTTHNDDPLCNVFYPAEDLQSTQSSGKVSKSTNKIKGIIHFLGGAFAGAAPSTLYADSIHAFTKAGFVVITNAYPVTFRHDVCARDLDQRFGRVLNKVLDELRGKTVDDPVKVFAVGHSNGALMVAMMSSMGECKNAQYSASILLSFNNRQVGEAVPIPLSGLQEILGSVRSGDTDLEDTVRAIALSNIRLLQESPLADTINMTDLETSFAQLGSVLDEVSSGLDDFSPPPDQNARRIAEGYSVPKTLLMQFNDDTIDQSEKLYRLLKKNWQRSVTFRSVEYGTHLSPLVEGEKVAKMCIDFIESRCL